MINYGTKKSKTADGKQLFEVILGEEYGLDVRKTTTSKLTSKHIYEVLDNGGVITRTMPMPGTEDGTHYFAIIGYDKDTKNLIIADSNTTDNRPSTRREYTINEYEKLGGAGIYAHEIYNNN